LLLARYTAILTKRLNLTAVTIKEATENKNVGVKCYHEMDKFHAVFLDIFICGDNFGKDTQEIVSGRFH
jgi:hypothetical protein